jgi:transposase InsO family protein
MATFVKDNDLSVTRVSKLTGLPDRSLYRYKSDSHPVTKRSVEDARLTQIIKNIFNENHGRYGSFKTLEILKSDYQIKSSKRRISNLMNIAKLIPITRRNDSNYKGKLSKNNPDRPNLLAGDFTTTAINQKWVMDITYLHTLKDGWTYLAVILDLHTRKVISYGYSRNIDTKLVVNTLTKAIRNEVPNTTQQDLILHTDNGVQFTSYEFEELLNAYGITHSYSRPGKPRDNAVIESFFSVLKNEHFDHYNYRYFQDMLPTIYKYIYWYNYKRIHGGINYLTPIQKEALALANAS